METLRRTTFGLAAILVLALAGAAKEDTSSAANASNGKTVIPQLIISIERQTLRETDRIPVRVLLVNPTNIALSDAKLAWHIPTFLKINVSNCSGGKQHGSEVDLGTVAGQSRKFCELELSSAGAQEADLTLLFELQYAWNDTSGPKASVLSAEKTVKSAFLGTDTFAGVPLSLAGFVVPGLLFWLILDKWKTPWRVEGPALGDKMIYSVLVSLLLIAVVSKMPWIRDRTDVTSGLSMAKLEWLALIGFVAGMTVGWVDRAARSYRARQGLSTGDDDLTLLGKLLRTNHGRSRPETIVRLANGNSFYGSVGAQTATHTFLAGWYQIHRDNAKPNETEAIANAVGAGDFYKALELGLKHHFAVDTRDFIYSAGADGHFAPTALMRGQWANADVQGKPVVQTGTNRDEPLIMV